MWFPWDSQEVIYHAGIGINHWLHCWLSFWCPYSHTFGSLYLQPTPWQLFHLTPMMLSAMTCAGIISSSATTVNWHWQVWMDFCLVRSMDPSLATVQDPIAILQVYVPPYCTWQISPWPTCPISNSGGLPPSCYQSSICGCGGPRTSPKSTWADRFSSSAST